MSMPRYEVENLGCEWTGTPTRRPPSSTPSQHHPKPRSIASTMADRSRRDLVAIGHLHVFVPASRRPFPPFLQASALFNSMSFQRVTVDVASHRRIVSCRRVVVSSMLAARAPPRHINSNHGSPTECSGRSYILASSAPFRMTSPVPPSARRNITIVASIGVVPVVDRGTRLVA